MSVCMRNYNSLIHTRMLQILLLFFMNSSSVKTWIPSEEQSKVQAIFTAASFSAVKDEDWKMKLNHT